MRSSFCRAARFPLGVGSPLVSLPAAKESCPFVDVSCCRCVGVVKRPQVALINGVATWQSQLIITTVGVSAADTEASTSCVVAQEHVVLKCIGERWFSFCRELVRTDSLVCVSGVIQQRPRYVAIHSNYRYTTEIHVSDQLGVVEVVIP